MKKKILIVEDDKTTCQILKSLLNSLEYEISGIAESGENVLEFLLKNQTDLILMDIGLEGKIDGIETTRIINETYNIPVIFVTSSSDKETIDRSKSVNPFGYIIKPIDKNELKTGIEMALVRFKMESALKENEHKLSTILNSIADAVIVIDKDGRITYINPVADKMLNTNSGQILNSYLNDVIYLETNKKMTEDISISEIDHDYLVLKDNTKIPVNYSASPIRDSLNKNSGAVIVIRDDTERMKSQQKLKESYERLRNTMTGIIEAMAQTLESRDPYTAGHQRRVSDLAREIAGIMNLPEDIVEGIRMSAIIHDIGKISIPAEILSKPGKLSNIEFDLMKTHPQTGYEILKNIDFPWPVADIIYQHHEKLNGTGYPRGLKGDEILLESKILSVADVVEAMASHRPYRPALGIETALEEILKYRTIYFDADIVDACISLFREKGYEMKFY
jgi:PAS domain S-box-containing protein/putative nucleotidyltransferase with HDIG domain